MKQIKDMTFQEASQVKFVLMDIDDTITTDGKLPAVAYSALWRCHEAGLWVIPITGRPAGWCDLIARQWPVDGVVGENGALVFWEEDGVAKRLYHPNAIGNDHPTLHRIQERVLAEVAESRISQDQFTRMFDLAIDFAEEEPILPLFEAQKIADICESEGAIAKISSIHVNTWLGEYDKLSMTRTFLEKRFNYDDESMRGSVIFFGDSPNDEPMFRYFPLSVGVASVPRYAHLMQALPAYVTEQAGGEGFAEGIDLLLARR